MQSVQCAFCIKQEPPDDDELETMSSGYRFHSITATHRHLQLSKRLNPVTTLSSAHSVKSITKQLHH